MLKQVRNETENLVRDSINCANHILIESPPASGKTWNAVQLAANTDYNVTYLAGRTDLYEQAQEIAEEDTDLTVETIPSPYRDCPTFKGDNGGDTEKVRRLYQKGIRARDIHYEGWDRAYTPCQTPDSMCPYIASLNRLRSDIDFGHTDVTDVDLLIGNHQHAYRESYLEDRIVIFDEFNPDPFVQRFPSEDSPQYLRDDPSEIISEFLETVENFPFEDLTDLIEARASENPRVKEAIEWFEQYEANAAAGKEIMDPSMQQYDASHTSALLLTLGVLLGEKIGPGIELAKNEEIWEKTGVDIGTRCLRDRNTNQMLVLNPPPVDVAEQVIGMDALPTKKLWDTIFDTTFELRQVLEREELDRYLTEGLGFSLFQLADGMNHYSGGHISDKDGARFDAVRLIEGRKFPIITRKKALERYRNQPWYERCVKRLVDIDGIDKSPENTHEYAGQHYATVLSSNKFEAEDIGVVSGSPYPNDDIVRRWAGLCGEPTEAIRPDGSLEGFEGFGQQVFKHFTHHQVFQAILRFGRDLPPEKEGEVSVYVNTEAIPNWITSITEFDVKEVTSEPKRALILEELFRTNHNDGPLSQQTVGTLKTHIDERLEKSEIMGGEAEISKTHIRNTLESEEFNSVITVERDGGTGGADLYEWNGDGSLHPRTSQVEELLLELDSSAWFLKARRQ